MRKLLIGALSAVIMATLLSSTAVAQPRRAEPVRPVPAPDPAPAEVAPFVFESPDRVRPQPVLPDDGPNALRLWGDVWANGRFVGMVDFALAWKDGPQPRAELWAKRGDRVVRVCAGMIFETPQGAPNFFGEATATKADATCHMARVPNVAEVSLFIATENGDWATSIMRTHPWRDADAALILD